MEGSITINDYTQMDRILREEKTYILNLCKQIQKTGCNVLLIQKSILRDAVNELSLAFLAKMKIMVVRDIEREDIEFISKVNVTLKRLRLKFLYRLWVVFQLLLSKPLQLINWELLS